MSDILTSDGVPARPPAAPVGAGLFAPTPGQPGMWMKGDTPRPRGGRRGWLPAIAGLIGLAVLGDDVAWHLASARLAAEFAAWGVALQSQGWRLSSGPPTKGGFPFGATLAVPDIDIAGGANALPGGVEWRAERVEVSLVFWHPWQLSITPEGRQRLSLSHLPPLAFTANSLSAIVPIGGGRSGTLDVAASVLAGGLAGSVHQQDVRVRTLALHFGLLPEKKITGITLQASATEIELPDTGRWPLGAAIKSASLQTTLTSPHVTGTGGTAQAAAWRNGGGQLAITALTLNWGPLNLTGQATLRLDANLQPSGDGTSTLTGSDATLDALAGGGVISFGLATTVKAMLAVMGPAPGLSRSDGAITLPFTLRDDTLAAGQIPLARLKPILWGGR